MAHYTKISGTSYEITGGRTLIGGTGYDIAKGRTLVGGTGYDINFKLKIGSLPVKTSVFTNFNGVLTEFLIVHQGNPDFDLYDTSCDGTWLLMKNIHERSVWDSSDNSYKDSDIHAYMNNTLFGLFDIDIQPIIKPVKIPYVNGVGTTGSVASGSNGLSTRIFSLGGYELGWTSANNSYFPVDGACLDYFSGMSSTDEGRIAYLNGSVTLWWTRSANVTSTNNAFCVHSNGSYYSRAVTQTWGVRPALIVYPNTAVDPNTFKILG